MKIAILIVILISVSFFSYTFIEEELQEALPQVKHYKKKEAPRWINTEHIDIDWDVETVTLPLEDFQLLIAWSEVNKLKD